MNTCNLNTCLYLFQNNLRIQDNPSLYYAYFHFWKVVPVLVIPSKANTHLNKIGQEMGKFRYQFFLEAALELKANLAKEKIDLILLKDDENLAAKLKEICKAYEIEHTVTSYPRGVYEGNILGMLCELTAVFTCEDDNLVAMDELPFTELPKVFTPFRKEVEANLDVRDMTQDPLLKKFADSQAFSDTFELIKHPKHPNSAYPFTGGESAAHERLNYYIGESKAILAYKETRNELIGENYSSSFLLIWLSETYLPYKSIMRLRALKIKSKKMTVPIGYCLNYFGENILCWLPSKHRLMCMPFKAFKIKVLKIIRIASRNLSNGVLEIQNIHSSMPI